MSARPTYAYYFRRCWPDFGPDRELTDLEDWYWLASRAGMSVGEFKDAVKVGVQRVGDVGGEGFMVWSNTVYPEAECHA